MNMQKETYNKFGKKMKELIKLIEEDSNWNKYVDSSTEKLINDLLEYKNMSIIMEKHKMTYGNLRAKYMVALRRISEKDTTKIRGGKSNKAIHLFKLIDSIPNWKEPLTENEILYIEKFKELKNFYAVSRELNVPPSNIVGAIYGTKQRVGAVRKIEKLNKRSS